MRPFGRRRGGPLNRKRTLHRSMSLCTAIMHISRVSLIRSAQEARSNRSATPTQARRRRRTRHSRSRRRDDLLGCAALRPSPPSSTHRGIILPCSRAPTPEPRTISTQPTSRMRAMLPFTPSASAACRMHSRCCTASLACHAPRCSTAATNALRCSCDNNG